MKQKNYYHLYGNKICIKAAQTAINVTVVYDVFAVAMEKLRSSFSNRKNVVEKNRTKRSPTAVFRNPSRFSGEAYKILLGAVIQSFFIQFRNIS
jgi:hypothetical protein